MVEKVNYAFDEQNRFVIENYNWAKPFSGFLPGIAGQLGIPLWAYYVNRGQAICSLGSRDKDGAILEFLSFNRACQLVGLLGYRTFLRFADGPVYEPFRRVRGHAAQQKLLISSPEISVLERNNEINLECSVTFFPLVSMPLSGLVRRITITNLSEEERELQLIDGVPRLLPHGVTFEHVKVISRHIEGMMGVFELEGIHLFRLKQTAADRPEVSELNAANYYLSTIGEGALPHNSYLVDPEVLFDTPNDFTYPWGFEDHSIEELLARPQMRENRTPCAFTALRIMLEPGGSETLYSVIGHTSAEEPLRQLCEALDTSFFKRKRVENQELIDRIKNTAFTASNHPLFDQYCQETFLENVMRGGMPTFFEWEGKSHVFYTYSRQNGDLERDYHWFVLEPTYLSQGNSHFRSICQNRRMDTWFFPKIEEHNIFMFMNLIQTDGYNPLVVNGQRYVSDRPEAIKSYLKTLLDDPFLVEELLNNLSKPFTPGELILWIDQHHPITERSCRTILGKVLPHCRTLEIGDIHEGFWGDHWLYLIDLLESFLLIYPDRLKEVLLERNDYSFFDNPDVVQPRSKKIVIQKWRVRQYGAVLRDPEKAALIESRKIDRNRVRTSNGKGEVYRTNLLVKLLCVLACKIATLDPFGVGIEMEADKPGWNDSMNGLPGLYGSSLCQTLELLRAFRFLEDSLSQPGISETDSYPVYRELATFIRGLTHTLNNGVGLEDQANLKKWDDLHGLLEAYRTKTRLGIGGEEEDFTIREFLEFTKCGRDWLEGIFSHQPDDRLFDPDGVPYTYYINDIVQYEIAESDRSRLDDETQRVFTKPTLFQRRPTALFLEGPVHYIKLFPEKARDVVDSVRRSKLFDKKLNMFKVCESLRNQPLEIGQIKAYASGWIENESIYTHMEFKWLLEILRSGLADVFFDEMQLALPPFLHPEIYGRSTLENCSFIVSSAFPDERLHGQAFQPRLSGVNAEMLEIWTLMVAGPKPFRMDVEGSLRFKLDPILPDWLFTSEGKRHLFWNPGDEWTEIFIPQDTFAFRFLGKTLVVYHNPSCKSTFGPEGVIVSGCTFTFQDNTSQHADGSEFSTELARAVRDGRVVRMDVQLK